MEPTSLITAGAIDSFTGGLATSFVVEVLRTAGKQIRGRFSTPEQKQALQNAVTKALRVALDAWVLSEEEVDHYRGLFGQWLKNPAVLGEFRTLLSPSEDSELDLALLQEEFEATGLSAEHLGKVSFKPLIQDLVGTFYYAAAEENELQELLKIRLLRQMVERMGAFERLDALSQRHVETAQRAVDHLAHIRGLAEETADGQDKTNELLAKILQVLSDARTSHSEMNLLAVFQQVQLALTTARLLPETNGSPQTNGASIQTIPALEKVLEILNDIRVQLTEQAEGPSPEELYARETQYRQTIIDQFEKLTFKGLSPSGTPIVLPLEQIYVELKAVADVPEAADTYSAEERRLLLEAEERGKYAREELALHLDTLRAERWNRQSRQDAVRLQRRSIQETLGDATQQGVVILGDPGSGKTTLLHYQALRAARAGLSSGKASVLPIFVPLAAYDNYLGRTPQKRSLEHFLAVYYDQWHSLPGLAPLFERALESGHALILLDGLDEVLDTGTRQFVSEQAGALIRQWASRGNRFALTSRIVGYREARLPGELPHVTVLDFGRPEIEIFAHQWCKSYEVWVTGTETLTALRQAAEEEKALLDDVRSNPSVERLAASPLLLTMLALLRRHVGKLPDRRVELYERYIRTLIDHWENARSAGARQIAPERFDPHRAIAHLIELAFWLQQNKPSGTARRQELEQELETICLRYEGHAPAEASPKARVQAQQDAAHFLRDMRHFAGLLAERGHNAFGFLHLTFQEYFSGRALARMEPEACWQAIQPNLHRPRWREPILLCAGQLGVMEQRRDRTSDLAGRILHANSKHEIILHRDLFLAAAIASDNVGLSNTLLEKLTGRLSGLKDSGIPTVRETALAGLTQIARIGRVVALEALQEALQHQELQYDAMRAAKAVIGIEACISLREVIQTKLDDPDSDVRRATIGALASLVSSEPTIREVIQPKLDDPNSDVQAATIVALASLVSSEPTIREAIQNKLDDPNWYIRYVTIVALASLVSSEPTIREAIQPKLDDPDSNVRYVTIEALASLVSSEPTIREAIQPKLDDPDSDVQAATIGALASLVSSEPTIREAIQPKLDDPNSNVRRATIGALASLVSSEPTIREVIQPKLDDPDSNVRYVTIEALASLVSSEPTIREAIQTKLDDPNSDVRRATIGALASLVSSEPTIREVIQPKLDDPDSNVQAATIGALASLVSSEPTIREAIQPKLDDPDSNVQAATIEALASLVSSEPTIREAIQPKLDDPDSDVQAATIGALASLVSSEPTIREAIQPKLDDPNSNVRRATIGALASLVSSEPTIREVIQPKLDDPDSNVRRATIGALASLVSSEPTIREVIQPKLDDPDSNVRYVTIEALASLVSSEPTIREAIQTKLDDPNSDVRRATIGALASLVSSEPTIREVIQPKLDDPDSNVQAATIEALASLVSSEPTIREVIQPKLDDPNSNVQAATIGALASLVSSEPTIREVIQPKLDDPNWYIRYVTIGALASLVSSEPTIREVIQTKLDDPDSDVRRAAVKALASLVNSDQKLRSKLLPWLGIIVEYSPNEARTIRHLLAKAYASLLSSNPDLLNEVTHMLGSAAWPVRQGAAWTLIAMPGGPPANLLPTLYGLLDDMRGEESWPRRLQVSALLINDRDSTLSQRAIAVALEALDYATQPWYDLPHQGSQVRQQAARILGTLEPLYRDEAVFARLARVLEEDNDAQVRDAAYGALLRLAAAPEEVLVGKN